MHERARLSFTFVVPLFLLLLGGSRPVATANPPKPNYTLIDLGTLVGGPSAPTGINARGQIVGVSDTASDEFHAFLWDAKTGVQDLGTLAGFSASAAAYGINARGQVVGYTDTAAGWGHAFLWEAGTGMQDLGTLGGSNSGAVGINERGQIVGVSETPTGQFHAILWEPGSE